MHVAEPGNRRPLASRQTAWARALAGLLARWKVPPNGISAASLAAALLATGCLVLWPQLPAAWGSLLLLLAAVGIQLRLLCNLLDGMVAVEGGLGTPTGEIWNEVPDRCADALILVGAGWSLAQLPIGRELGWTAALLALLTAYVRSLAAQLGLAGCFLGPMAKPQRMACLTMACLVAGCLVPWGLAGWTLWCGLALIVVGTAVTVVRRLRALAQHLRRRAGP